MKALKRFEVYNPKNEITHTYTIDKNKDFMIMCLIDDFAAATIHKTKTMKYKVNGSEIIMFKDKSNKYACVYYFQD